MLLNSRPAPATKVPWMVAVCVWLTAVFCVSLGAPFVGALHQKNYRSFMAANELYQKSAQGSRKISETDVPDTDSAVQSLSLNAHCDNEGDYRMLESLLSSEHPHVRSFEATSLNPSHWESSIHCHQVNRDFQLGSFSACKLENVALDWTKIFESDGNSHFMAEARYSIHDGALVISSPPVEFEVARRIHLSQLFDQPYASHPRPVPSPSLMKLDEFHAKCVSGNTRTYPHALLAVSRRDEHNPFFMLAVALNAFIVQKAFGVSPTQTQVLALDDGYRKDLYSTAYAELLHKLIGPNFQMIEHFRPKGESLPESVLEEFTCVRTLLTTPNEFSSPLTAHDTGHKVDCGQSGLIQEFKQRSLESFDIVPQPKSRLIDQSTTRKLRVTFLVRRQFQQRKDVSRIIANEQDVIDVLTDEEFFEGSPDVCNFGEETWTMRKQMEQMQRTDILVGFHGGQLTGVMWLPKGALVIEIMEKDRGHYMYETMALYTGVNHRTFRIQTAMSEERRGVGYTVPAAEIKRELSDAIASVRETGATIGVNL